MDAVATFVSRARPRQSTLFAPKRETRDPNIPFPLTAEPATGGVLVPMQRHLAVMRRQLIVGLLIGACAAGIVAFAAIKFSRNIQESRATAKPPAELPAPAEQATGSALLAPPVASGPTTDVFAISNQKKGGLPARAAASPPADPAGHPSRLKNNLTPDQAVDPCAGRKQHGCGGLGRALYQGRGRPSKLRPGKSAAAGGL